MINSRADYVVAEPPQGITIDGGIMPARDVANDGSWKIIRGEDPSFLMEAGLRINAYAGFTDAYPYSGGSFPYPVGTVVNGQGSQRTVLPTLKRIDLENAITLIHKGSPATGSGTYTWPEAPVFITPTYSGTTSGGTPWRYYTNALSTSSPSARTLIDAVLTTATQSQSTTWRYLNWNQSGYGDQLRADRIRDMYYDLNRVKGVTSGYVNVSKSGEYTKYRLVGWDPVFNYDGDNHAISLAGAVETPGQWQTYAFSSYANWTRGNYLKFINYDTEYDFVLGFTGKAIPARLNPNCTVLTLVHTIHYTTQVIYSFPTSGSPQATPVDGPQENYYDILAADVTFSNTGEASFSIPSSLVIDLATRNRNLPTQWSDVTFSTSGNTVNGEVLNIAQGSCAVLFYDSGIDFSSLNWVYPT